MPFARARDTGVLGGTPAHARVSHLIDRCAETAACRRAIARDADLKTARCWLSESHVAIA